MLLYTEMEKNSLGAKFVLNLLGFLYIARWHVMGVQHKKFRSTGATEMEVTSQAKEKKDYSFNDKVISWRNKKFVREEKIRT